MTRAKWTGITAEAVECLLCNGKPRVQAPGPPKKKKKKKKAILNLLIDFFSVLRIEPKASHILGKCSTSDL
jgi:hypothetical protein